MYSRADRLLHRLALGSPALLEAVFDIERARFGRAARALSVERPVFVTGMARAGTTILTRMLHESGGFATASYRDLPFPLAPNGWARLGGKRQVVASERGHGDGMLHDLDSPKRSRKSSGAVSRGIATFAHTASIRCRPRPRPSPPSAIMPPWSC